MSTIITNFPVTVYDQKGSFSDTISRGRCRVFYKGLNRNGTYITDEFAQKLIASAPYTPVKGIYDDDGEDYTDHGQKRSEGRIYGVVPADPNFAWEKHLDPDGKEREYACFDVLYYTALYKEAGEIGSKSQSMELYRQTLKGEWKIVEGKKVYVFTEGCFLGLQALGDDVEPCFEGASFYTCEDSILKLLEKYEKRPDIFQYHEQGGNNTMPSITFKVSDGQKYDFLFSLLNPNFNEAGGWTIECIVCEVYDEYAVVHNCMSNIYERVYYIKDDENDSLEITSRERCYIVDINETEKAALDSLKGESTYEQVAANIAEKDNTINSLNEQIASLDENVATLTAENSTLNEEKLQYSTKIEEQENMISTLSTERDTARSEYDTLVAEKETEVGELHNRISTLETSLQETTAEKDALAAYKKNNEDELKRGVIDQYIENLPEEVIEKYTTNMDNYSIEDLDKELTYELKKVNPSLFNNKTPAHVQAPLIPKDEEINGINTILSRYEKTKK